jgi:hypothetical protein
MKINVRRCDAKNRLIKGGYWHRWFAWHPVKIGHQWAWMETVMRRRVGRFAYDGWWFEDFYRLMPNTNLSGAASASERKKG